MPHIPLIARHSGSSACGVTPQDAPRAAYHTRTPERAPYRGGKRGVPWLHTLCGVRYAMPHRVSPPPEQGSLIIPRCSISPEFLNLLKRGHENASRGSLANPPLASIGA